MSIAPPPSNSSASSTTDIAPTHTTSKVLEGHQPSIPASVSDKYKEGLEDSSKRPKENIHAQEDFIKSLPRKDVSFGAEAALDRDRVPLVKRTEVHAVPAETSQEHLLNDKHIEAADVQIPPTQSQSQIQKENENEKEKEKEKENIQASKSTLESESMSSKQSSPSESKSMSSKQESSSPSMSSIQSKDDKKLDSQSPSMSSSTQQDADKKQDAIQASTESFKDDLSKQDKQLEASATQHQQKLIAKEHKDTIETETPQFKQNIEKHNQQVEQKEKSNLDVPTPPTKELQTEKSTAKKWEDTHVQPFDIPRTTEQASQTREKPAETSKSSAGLLPTDQYDLKSESNSNKEESNSTQSESNSNSNQQDSKLIETIKSSESMIQEKLAGLVHTITHDLPTAARELLHEYEASKSQSKQTEKSSSDGGLPTDQYDLKTKDTQKDATESVKATNDKVLEEKHVEPFDDHKTEPSQHNFIHDKLAGLMHTVTHDLPARAKELLAKHEENKSQPPSPTQAPIIQEREEKQEKEQSVGSSSIIKERGLDPEDMLFL